LAVVCFLLAICPCRSPCSCSSRARAGIGPCRTLCTCSYRARARTSLPVDVQPCTYYCKPQSCTWCRFHCRFRLFRDWCKLCTWRFLRLSSRSPSLIRCFRSPAPPTARSTSSVPAP
jgi:hypothetical protein